MLDAYFEDTMRAGHYENRKESVEIMIRGSRAVIDHLIEIGVPFNRTPDGELQYTKEGAHSAARICFYKDITGQAITETLQNYVKGLSNVTILENTTMKDILVENDKCTGILAETKDGDTLIVHAKDTVLAVIPSKKSAVFFKWMKSMGTSIDEQSKQKAYSLFEDGIINTIEVGT